MTAILGPLQSYDINPQTGFMPSWEPQERLDAGFEPWWPAPFRVS